MFCSNMEEQATLELDMIPIRLDKWTPQALEKTLLATSTSLQKSKSINSLLTSLTRW